MATLWVGHAPTSASLVRRGVSTALGQAGVSADETFDAALIASELVGNAVRHSMALPSGRLAVEWLVEADSFWVSVTDGGGRDHVGVRKSETWDTSGRGLAIVAAIADEWGVEVRDRTTTVWAHRRLRSRRAARVVSVAGRGQQAVS